MGTNYFTATILSLALTSVLACASSDSPATDGASDEDLSAAADVSEPLRADLVTALKKVNRASLLPSRVAFVFPQATHNQVLEDAKYTGDDRLGFNNDTLKQVTKELSTRGLRIVGKKVTFSHENCKFSGTGDYLGLVTSRTFLSGNMRDGNAAFAPEVIYSDARIAKAKAIEAAVIYKLTLTQERYSIYLAKQGNAWKVLAIDIAEFQCAEGEGL